MTTSRLTAAAAVVFQVDVQTIIDGSSSTAELMPLRVTTPPHLMAAVVGRDTHEAEAQELLVPQIDGTAAIPPY